MKGFMVSENYDYVADDEDVKTTKKQPRVLDYFIRINNKIYLIILIHVFIGIIY